MTFLNIHDQHRLEEGCWYLLRLGGPRPLGMLLLEVVTAGDDLASLLDRLDSYRQYSPGVMDILGGSNFPPRPLVVVPR